MLVVELELLLNKLFLGTMSHLVLATCTFHFSGTGGTVSGFVVDKKVGNGEMDGGEWEGL